MAVHELTLDAANLHGYFSRELDPVLSVEPGDSVTIAVPNAGWNVGRDEPFPRNPELDTGHALAGPIEVRGARAGGVLAIRIDEVRPGPWGVTVGGPEHRLDWELANGIGRVAGRSVRLAPFLGVLGMPPPEGGVHSTIPPRPWGGNIDCKELVAGATLFLPIPVDGALFSAGDGHAAQGDGEVSGTAIETPVEAQLTLDVRDDLELQLAARARSKAPGSPSASTSTWASRRGLPSTACSTCSNASTGSRARMRWRSRRSWSTCA